MRTACRRRLCRFPETKPATEFIDGRLAQKMSPFGLHARVQRVVAAALGDWSDERGRGRVGTEWDFDLTPTGGRTNRLVPDVAFLSYDRVPYEDEAEAQVPIVAPDVAIEILSQGQTLENSERRISIFLACGAKLIVLLDPRREVAWLVDAAGSRELAQRWRDRARIDARLPVAARSLLRADAPRRPPLEIRADDRAAVERAFAHCGECVGRPIERVTRDVRFDLARLRQRDRFA